MARRLLTQWKLPIKECSCVHCKGMCIVPCWPTPEEAKKLIELGYGNRLMLNSRFYDVLGKEVFLLCPAKKEQETLYAESESLGPSCTFQTSDGLCSLHNICKPLEGRLAICKGREPVDLRLRILELWDNEKAKNLVTSWIKKFMTTRKKSFYEDLVTENY